jgi:hypothetical protein
MTTRIRRILACGLVGVALSLSGCASGLIPPTYTGEELAAKCSRDGGVWRAHVADGYCEHQSPGFI